MDDMDRNQHSVYLLYYHLIMVVKYCRKVIDDAISEQAKDLFVKIGRTTAWFLKNGTMISITFMSCSVPNPRPSLQNLSTLTKAPAAL